MTRLFSAANKLHPNGNPAKQIRDTSTTPCRSRSMSHAT
jgi:hypothetical protein